MACQYLKRHGVKINDLRTPIKILIPDVDLTIYARDCQSLEALTHRSDGHLVVYESHDILLKGPDENFPV